MSQRMSQRWIMFGHSQFLGDMVEIMRARGDLLDRIVINVPEVVRTRQLPLADRIARLPYHVPQVMLEPLDDLALPTGVSSIIGFLGAKKAPLVTRLKLDSRIQFGQLIHPSAVIAESAILGEGVIVNALAVVAAYAHIGDQVVINRGATIGHDADIGAYAVVQSNANVSGNTRIGMGAVISAGATVIERIVVGDEAVVAAGAVVIRDVEARSMVAGVPAMVKRAGAVRSGAVRPGG